MAETSTSWKHGGCHCRAVRFEVLAPGEIEAKDCNCSICRMTGYLHLIVPAERFRLLTGADKLTTYTFNTGAARHRFCSVCGIKSFYVPRSRPDGYSVNVRCMQEGTFREITVKPFDGRRWEESMGALSTERGT